MKPILLIFTLLITTLSFHAQDLKLGIPVGHTDIINSAIYSPDGKLVLTSSDDKTARLWDHATGKLIRTFKGHKEAVSIAIFSPDGSKIVTSDDLWSMIWDVGSGRVIDSLNAPDDPLGLFAGSETGAIPKAPSASPLVGDDRLDEFSSHQHLSPMLSLDNTYDEVEFFDFDI